MTDLREFIHRLRHWAKSSTSIHRGLLYAMELIIIGNVLSRWVAVRVICHTTAAALLLAEMF